MNPGALQPERCPIDQRERTGDRTGPMGLRGGPSKSGVLDLVDLDGGGY